MVGLSIVLESHKAAHRKPTTQVFNKSSMINADRNKHLLISSSSSSSPPAASGFLEMCFLCGQKLLPGMDIYMYKGDRAFCSVECRYKHMNMDEQETATVKKKKHQYCATAAVGGSGGGSSSSPAAGSHRKNGRGGGFVY
ncbi:FCS-Like Zinc finger 15 [Linum perenne]